MRLVQEDALKSPLFEKLNALLKSPVDKVKYRAIWAISNLISNGTHRHI